MTFPSGVHFSYQLTLKIASEHERHRWLMYSGHLSSVSGKSRDVVLGKFGAFICKRWNKGRVYADQVHAFSFINVGENTKIVRGGANATEPDTISETPREPVVIWRHSCFDVPVPPKWQGAIGPWQPALHPAPLTPEQEVETASAKAAELARAKKGEEGAADEKKKRQPPNIKKTTPTNNKDEL
jgi:hypothetical protein